MDQKQEFVLLALQHQISFSELCRRYAISRKTGYKWLDRYGQLGEAGLKEQSRCPVSSPFQTSCDMEQRIIALRRENPVWGAKKLYKLLETDRSKGLFKAPVPARSTIHEVLKRNGLIDEQRSLKGTAVKRFEHDYPNELWQMDFKGDFMMLNSKRCHALTITDDHSRFNLGLFACGNETLDTVKSSIIKVFQRYGIPDVILTDNGPPWGTVGHLNEQGTKVYSIFEKWLITKRIKLIHGRPYHPQTQGKEERFHRTLKEELLNRQQYRDLHHCQASFDLWREKYNCYRPHEAINFEVPAKRYKPSLRAYENVITKPEYNSTDVIRRADHGWILFRGKHYRIGKAFSGDDIAIRQTNTDGVFEVYFYEHLLRKISFI